MDVILTKVGHGPAKSVSGKLTRPPKKGAVVIVEFPDGLHEYVTTPVRRILQSLESNVYYIQTSNSRYRLEVQSNEIPVMDNSHVAR